MFPILGIPVGVQLLVSFQIPRLEAQTLGEGSLRVLDLTLMPQGGGQYEIRVGIIQLTFQSPASRRCCPFIVAVVQVRFTQIGPVGLSTDILGVEPQSFLKVSDSLFRLARKTECVTQGDMRLRETGIESDRAARFSDGKIVIP